MTLQPASKFEPSNYYFNARELARLAVYRAAVVARFYTDECDPSPTPIRNGIDAARFFDSVRGERRAA